MGANFKDFTHLVLERGEGKEKERERNSHQLLLTRPQPGTCLKAQAPALTGISWQTCGLREDAQPTEPHWPGLKHFNT